MASAPSPRFDGHRRGRRPSSRRFLSAEELQARTPTFGQVRAWGPGEIFAEGQWQAIRVQLERHGWNPSQIELVHDQLRQGWPLATAKLHAARLSGHCPIKGQVDL
ncbi:MAG: hypothetical protein VKM98_03985 [Cyanobacteriota bacterium]|nr:hypothetical protein [Cyanobacteriota bacterium]